MRGSPMSFVGDQIRCILQGWGYRRPPCFLTLRWSNSGFSLSGRDACNPDRHLLSFNSQSFWLLYEYGSLTDSSLCFSLLSHPFLWDPVFNCIFWLVRFDSCLKNFAVQFIWSWGPASLNYIKLLMTHTGGLFKYLHTSHSLQSVCPAVAERWPSAYRSRQFPQGLGDGFLSPVT